MSELLAINGGETTQNTDILLNGPEKTVSRNGIETEEIDSCITNQFTGKTTKKEEIRTAPKRSSRRQTGSIIQSAIARKEKAFDYDTNTQKRQKKRMKKEQDFGKPDSYDSTKLTGKKYKHSKAESSESETSESVLAQNVDSALRRSVRISSSDKEDLKSTNTKDNINGDNSTENSINLRLCKCTENKNLYLDSPENEKNNIDLKSTFTEINQGTLLHLATKQGHLTVLHLLISKGIDIDVFDKDQNTPLMLAVIEHKNDLVEFLIQSGSDIKLKGTDGMTALHIAAKCGNLKACKLIFQASFGIPDFINMQDDGGWTPLVWACEHSHLQVVKFLIEKGASVTLRDVEHNSALHWAALSGSNDIVELLLNFGCEVNAVNVHGETPLHISSREDHVPCVITLLARGADISLVNGNNERPVDCAVKNGRTYTAIALNMKLQKNVMCGNGVLLHNDISRGREQNPIQCHNSLDDEAEPRDYVYILKNRFASDEITIDTRISIMRSCTCEDRCVTTTGCSCNEVSVGHWYDQEGKLIPEFNFNDPPMLFECNEMCNCNYITCTNRVVQKGLTHRFQLFRTRNKGWGVKTLNAIPKGSFVCEYIGEILTDKEADRREDDSYLFDLDNRESDSFCVDAKFYGNFARFINHSCDPNLHSIKVFVDHHDLRFPRIALFAKRDISAAEELSFDYGDKFWLVKYKSFTCDCQVENCKYSAESIHKTLETYYENYS